MSRVHFVSPSAIFDVAICNIKPKAGPHPTQMLSASMRWRSMVGDAVSCDVISDMACECKVTLFQV